MAGVFEVWLAVVSEDEQEGRRHRHNIRLSNSLMELLMDLLLQLLAPGATGRFGHNNRPVLLTIYVIGRSWDCVKFSGSAIAAGMIFEPVPGGLNDGFRVLVLRFP